MTCNRISADMLRDAVIYFIRERNVSVPTILEHVEISRSRLYDYLQGNGKVSATTLTNILMIIGVTADEVMLQIFLSHPETWDNTVVHISRTLKDGGEVNAQFVKDVLVDYKHTRNVDILTTLITAIKSVDDDNRRRELMIPVVKTVQTTLMRLTFFTALDFRLFTNIMDYMPYEDVKTVAREIRDHAALMQQLSEAGSSVCDRFFSTYELKNMTDILFHFLTRAYQEEDEFALQEVMSFLSAFQVPRQEWYFNFVAKLASVYDLVHKGDAVVARHTYDQLMDTLAFMLPADVQADYLDMTRGSFELFVDEMKPRLHQIDKRLITNGHRR